MPEYRRGAAAIEDAASSKGGGNFRSFVPEIFWKEDSEKKYIAILTPIDEVGEFDLHDFIPIERKKNNGETYTAYESFLSRKDPFLAEDFDKIEDELGRKSKIRCIGVAVELEPVLEQKKGRMRPTGFSVKTDTFERKTDDGEETVIYPLIGLISQSSKLMWSPLASLDNSQGPLEDLPLEIIRRIPGGEKSNTSYEFVPFVDIPIDYSGVTEYVDGVSYLGENLEELVAELESIGDDDLKGAQAVAQALFTKRVDELADPDRYEELLGDIDELPAPPWGGGTKPKSTTKASRPVRKTQRTRKAEPTSEETPPSAETKGDKFARLKARIEG